MPTYTFNLNGRPSTSTRRPTCRCSGCCVTSSAMTGPKYGCGVGVCKACTSHINGQATQICTVTVPTCAGTNVTTIEGLAKNGTLHPVQQAWLDEDVAQCGFCQPGQIMEAAAMLKTTKAPTDADIDAIMNVCRCGTYFRIRAAIKRAASLR